MAHQRHAVPLLADGAGDGQLRLVSIAVRIRGLAGDARARQIHARGPCPDEPDRRAISAADAAADALRDRVEDGLARPHRGQGLAGGEVDAGHRKPVHRLHRHRDRLFHRSLALCLGALRGAGDGADQGEQARARMIGRAHAIPSTHAKAASP